MNGMFSNANAFNQDLNGWCVSNVSSYSNFSSSALTTANQPNWGTCNTFYLAGNGVPIRCDKANTGDTGTINTTTYTKRSKSQITTTNAALAAPVALPI